MITKTEKFNKHYNQKLFKNQNINKFKSGDKIKIVSNKPNDDYFPNHWSLGECFSNWDEGNFPELFSVGEVVDVRTFVCSWLPKDKKLNPTAIIEVGGKCYIVDEKCLKLVN
jgi:hypothetical protein